MTTTTTKAPRYTGLVKMGHPHVSPDGEVVVPVGFHISGVRARFPDGVVRIIRRLTWATYQVVAR